MDNSARYMLFDEIVKTAMEQGLDGCRSILDVGSGCFGSAEVMMRLAREGRSTAVLDRDPNELAALRRKMESQGTPGLTLFEGDFMELDRVLAGRRFDAVCAIDGPFEYCGGNGRLLISQLAAAATKRIVLTVRHPIYFASSVVRWDMAAQQLGVGAPFSLVRQFLDHRDTSAMDLPKPFGLHAGAGTRCWSRQEAEALVRAAGWQIEKVMALGSLAALCPESALRKIERDEVLKERFIALDIDTGTLYPDSTAIEVMIVATIDEGRELA